MKSLYSVLFKKMHSTETKKIKNICIVLIHLLSLDYLSLGHEMGTNAIQPPGQDLTACIGDQKRVFKLGRSLSISCYRSPTIRPCFILPTT